MMSAAPEPPSSTPPDWPHCGQGTTSADPVGCRGIRVGGHTACLAHLREADRIAYLATLSPGADIVFSGTSFTPELLDQLLTALHDPTTGRPNAGDARFNEASFSGDAWYGGATFTGAAQFSQATFTGAAKFHVASFSGQADFYGATFTGAADFYGATFTGAAKFDRATFTGAAKFHGATFSGDAWFDEATFSSRASFRRVTFSGNTEFRGVIFSDEALFKSARFEMAPSLGPLVCGKDVVLDGAVFQQPVTVEIAARRVNCARTRWAATATLRLRYAKLVLSDAVLEFPVLVTARPTPFPRLSADVPETELSGLEPGVHLTTLSGVDAAHLVLHDIDLSRCHFAGAVHLDQLKVDGWCTFDSTISWASPWWRSQRNTLAEEYHWRLFATRPSGRAIARDALPEDSPVLTPAAVAALYRQLRKSLEDGKNEPDAADFYYGECEMRRHDPGRPWGERALLTTYWALSGYGLRAIRALAWLGAAMAATIAVMMLWGLPTDDPKPTTTGRQVAAGQKVVLTTDTPTPVNPSSPLTGRLTTERFEKSLQVVINSAIFRSSGQNLTTAGTYTEMASRLAEPALLGLAVLAVRSRVKR